MSIAELFVPRGPEFRRQIERDYHLRMTAKNTEELKLFQAEALKVQTEIAAEILRVAERSSEIQPWEDIRLPQMEEYMTALLSGVERVNDALDVLNGTASETLEVVMDLSRLLDELLGRISSQIVAQQATLDDIAALLRRPYQTRARELRKEADKWFISGMGRTGRERDEDWKDAIRLLKSTTDNAIGMQDYVAFFQLGWLLWKHEHNIAAAEDAFYRAQRLSTAEDDLYHLLSLRHLAYMQDLLGKHQDAYETIHLALSVSYRDHDTMYDAARCSAKTGREQEAIDFLDKCIDRQPTTIVTMFSEADFRSTLAALKRLAHRRLVEGLKRLGNDIPRCELVIQGAETAEKILGVRVSSLLVSRAAIETILTQLKTADYLSCLHLGARVIEIGETVTKQCTAEIQDEIARRRDDVKMSQAALADIARQQESIVSGAKRQGESLIGEQRVQSEAEIRHARLDVEAAERTHDLAGRDSSINPRSWHWGLGCLTHLLVLLPLFYLFFGLNPGYIDNLPLGLWLLWLLSGWILFAYFFSWLSTELRVRSLASTVSGKGAALEQTKLRQEQLLKETQRKADALLEEAKAKVQNQFAERVLSLENDLREQRNRVAQAGSMLSSFTSLK